jgi:hypothetical protein
VLLIDAANNRPRCHGRGAASSVLRWRLDDGPAPAPSSGHQLF